MRPGQQVGLAVPRHSHEIGDDRNRYRSGVVGDGVKRTAQGGPIEQPRRQRGDGLALHLSASLGEGAIHRRPDPGVLGWLEVDKRPTDHPAPGGEVLRIGAPVDVVEGEYMTNVAPEPAVAQDAGDVAMGREERQTPRVVEVRPLIAQAGIHGVRVSDESGVVGVETGHLVDTTGSGRWAAP